MGGLQSPQSFNFTPVIPIELNLLNTKMPLNYTEATITYTAVCVPKHYGNTGCGVFKRGVQT